MVIVTSGKQRVGVMGGVGKANDHQDTLVQGGEKQE